jgi:hypothetical protein
MKKRKSQVIVVPTTSKTIKKKTKKISNLPKQVETKLIKSRPLRSKENTLAYYNCLIDQVANPSNSKVKITQLTHHCKCSKDEVAQTQAHHKQQLIQQLAQSYKTFGESLGHYLHADIVGCAKELKK